MNKNNDIYRSVICKGEIISGGKVLRTALYYGRRLYNHVWWFVFGYNRKLKKIRYRNGFGPTRGDGIYDGTFKDKFPNSIDLWKEFHNDFEYKILNDRVASYLLRNFAGSTKTWLTNRKENPELNPQPPGYSKDLKPLTLEVGKGAKYLGNKRWRLTLLSKQFEKRYVYIDLFLPPFLENSIESIQSIKCLQNKTWVISYNINPEINYNDGVAAIDLGIKNICTIAFDNGESILYSGGLLLSMQRYYSKEIAKCKPVGYKGENWDKIKEKNSNKYSDHSKNYWKKYASQKRLFLDNLTNSIIQECLNRKVSKIIVGDLKNIRKQKYNGNPNNKDSRNQKLHAWPFGKVIEMLEYKGEQFGIGIEKINESYTSITCSFCGYRNTKDARITRGLLICENCGIQINADLNGSIGILKRYLPADKRLEVVARFRSHSSLEITQGNDKPLSQIYPTFSAKFDLRNYEATIKSC